MYLTRSCGLMHESAIKMLHTQLTLIAILTHRFLKMTVVTFTWITLDGFFFCFFMSAVDQPQIKGPHMRFRKLVHLGKYCSVSSSSCVPPPSSAAVAPPHLSLSYFTSLLILPVSLQFWLPLFQFCPQYCYHYFHLLWVLLAVFVSIFFVLL